MTDHDPCDVPAIDVRIVQRPESPWLLPLAVVLLICLVVTVGPLVLIATIIEACLIVARRVFSALGVGRRQHTVSVGVRDTH